MATVRVNAKLFSLKLLDRQLASLKKIQRRDGTALAEQIRRGVDLWIARRGKGE